ncbi:MAG TPA: two-component regulator propeller domain-containing protein [Anaerolineales bacterium]|nr:two-component regulator propeller domain-containing protein [Anaerolineales bacterium]
MTVILAAVCFLFDSRFAVSAHAQTASVRFENISTEQGLSQATVNAILQDRQGFLWLGTEGGLNQYDGYSFTVFKHDPDDSASLSDNIVEALYEDENGSIWIGTSRGLDELDPKTGTFLQCVQGLNGEDIHAIAQDASGTLWIGTGGNGLYAMELATHKLTQYEHNSENSNSLSDDFVDSIFVSRDGTVWIGTDAGFDQFDRQHGSFVHSPQFSNGSPFTGNVAVYAIYEDHDGMLWIGTQQGLIAWNRHEAGYVIYRHEPNVAASLSDSSIRSIDEDSQGNLWIGTRSGLDQFNENQGDFIPYTHDPNDLHSLSSNSIRSILEDRSGVLWIGTSDGGLNKYARATQKFTLYTYHPGAANNLSDDNIWSIYEDQTKDLWLGTFFSGLNELDPRTGKVTIYQHNPAAPTSLSDNEVRAIWQGRNGVLWVGTERGGLDRFDSKTGTFLSYRHDALSPGSLSDDGVFAIFEDHLGQLWIGTASGGLNRFEQDSGTFIHYQHDAHDPTSLSDNQVRTIFEDHTGALWIGTFGGLDLWQGPANHFTIYRHDPKDPSSLSNDMVLSILEDKNGIVWIGTFGGGLERYDRNTQSFAHYTQKNGLPDDTVYGILADTDGSLWLSTNRGLSRFDPTSGKFRNYDISDGLQGDQFNPGAYFENHSGEMFFGGTHGANAFFPQQVKDNPIPPPVVITAVNKFNQTIETNPDSNAAIQLTYRDSFISFEFAALDYNAPEKNQYAYRLQGVDQDWVLAGTRRYASYTNLPGGDYIFQVKASNNDNIWNENATFLHIHVMPPFWETWWFIGIVGLVVVAGSIGGYRWRVRDIEASNRELTKRVEQRTHHLATLNAIAGLVNRSLELKEVMQDALERTIEVTGMDVGSALLLDEATQELVLIVYHGAPNLNIPPGARWPLASALAGKSLDGAHTLSWNVATDYPEGRLKDNLVREGVKSVVGVPLVAKERMVGMLVLNTRSSQLLTQEESSLLSAIGQQVGIAVENARLYEQAEQAAAIAERSRLARELHDSVTQLIYSVTLYAEAAAELLGSGETETAAGHLRELRDTAKEALREMRLLIFELREPALEKSGLATALQTRLEAVELRGGVQAQLQVEGVEQVPDLVQQELYNIASEALNNALKHARANNVQIRLRFDNDQTTLEISDDGIGFEYAIERLGGGFGISGMKERAQKLRGTLEIQTAPGKGTRVIARVPLSGPTS